MANIKISELDELVAVANDDYLPIVDTSAGETKKVKNSNLAADKLDKSNVKTITTNTDNDVYSCNYINIKGKTLRCGINSNQEIPSQTVTKVNFDKYLLNNFNDEYENYFRLNDGNIEIMNDNISCVIFVASCQTNGIKENNIYITKSGTGRFAVSTNSASGNSTVAIIPVTKGDKIYVEFYGDTAGSISNWTDMTFIEIAAI